MLKSMTGYGKGEAAADSGRFVVEIRSVNHRYGEISIRMPRQFQMFEVELKRQIAALLKRGKIDVSVQWEELTSLSGMPHINSEMASGYYHAFSRISHELGITEPISLSLIISQKGVLQERGDNCDVTVLLPVLQEAAKDALNAIDSMRCREGEILSTDLRERQFGIESAVASIRDAVPQMVADYRKKLAVRLEAILGDTQLDPDRLTQEVALMADRSDVTEEIVRLSSHFKQWNQTVCQNEPVGRKLDFLMQEMNREINTIGSKANDTGIANLVIQIKAEMEKIREQVQNIE